MADKGIKNINQWQKREHVNLNGNEGINIALCGNEEIFSFLFAFWGFRRGLEAAKCKPTNEVSNGLNSVVCTHLTEQHFGRHYGV